MPSVVMPTLSSDRWEVEKTSLKSATLTENYRVTQMPATWMLPDAALDDLLDVFDGLVVVLQAVVTQGDVVGQRWRSDRQEDRRNKMNISRPTSEICVTLQTKQHRLKKSFTCNKHHSYHRINFNTNAQI